MYVTKTRISLSLPRPALVAGRLSPLLSPYREWRESSSFLGLLFPSPCASIRLPVPRLVLLGCAPAQFVHANHLDNYSETHPHPSRTAVPPPWPDRNVHNT